MDESLNIILIMCFELTKAPAADSSVFVLRSSREASPSQYLSDVRRLKSPVVAMESVTLFSWYDSIATSSAPYLQTRCQEVCVVADH